MFSKRFLRTTLGFLSLGTGLLSSCGESGDYAILVHVNGSPTDTVSLYATAKLGGTLAMQGMDITTQLDSIGIRLPADKSGILTLDISALGTDQCKSATGSVTVDLSKGRGQEVTVNLASLNPRLCSLIIDQTGEGNVTLTPQGVSCGTNCYDYNQGATTVLKFNATGKSYGAQVYVSSGGICDGYNDCSINMAKRVKAEVKFQPRLCQSSWCWYNPLPQGNALSGLWGTSASDIWAVGDFGTAMHYDGKTWSLVNANTTKHLNGVYASAAGAAVVVGDTGLITRWNGTAFVTEPSSVVANLNSVWGTATNNLFAVGDGGAILRNTGNGWTPMTSGTTSNLYRVQGSAPDNVWAVGQSGTVRSYGGVGAIWNTVAAPFATTAPLADVWTSGPNDVWAVGGTTGGDCAVYRRDGVMWKQNNTCSSGITAVWGNSPRDVWTGSSSIKTIQRFVDSDVSKAVSTDILSAGSLKGLVPTYRAAWGSKEGEVYLATSHGNVLRYVADPPSTQLAAPLSSVYARGSGELAVVTGTGTSEYFLYDDGTVFGSDGRKISALPSVPGISALYDGYTAPTGELFVSGNAGNVYKYTPATNAWTSMKAGTITAAAYAIGGVSANDFYVGTSLGNIYRYVNGAAPASASYTNTNIVFQSIWGRTANEVWAIGGYYAVRINNGAGTIQAAVPTGVSDVLYGVGGPPSPSTHVWMVGAGGLVIRYDGTTWSKPPVSPAVTADLFTVVALSETDVWMAGDAGVVLHWDGASLKQVTGPYGNRMLTKMHSPAPNDLWMVGYGNTVLRYQP